MLGRVTGVPARFASTLSASGYTTSTTQVTKSLAQRCSQTTLSMSRSSRWQSKVSGSSLCSRATGLSTTLARTPEAALREPAAVASAICGQRRGLWDWALRPYAFDIAANAGTGLSTLSGGFSNVSLSLLVCPWKMLPTAILILPMAWALPMAYRMLFSNCSRPITSSIYNTFVQFIPTFLPVPAFENLFAELTFYITALTLTFFMYNLFPELMLEDGIWIFYSGLFVMSMFPLAFNYLPFFATRTYLIL